MTNYLNKLLNKNQTPQNLPIPGTAMRPNSAGGYSFAVDDWQRLHRFLILGSEGGTYYISERALTVENANAVLACIQRDDERVVREIVAISEAGRAPKNDPAIFALALVASHGGTEARRAAMAALPQVCRTGTHLFQFATYAQSMRGWGRGLRRGVAGWYHARDARGLVYQLVKYRQRDGWTHADTLRLAHPKPSAETQGMIFRWVTHREDAAWARDITPPEDAALAFIWAFERAQAAQDVETIVKLIERYDLPREALPTQWLNEAAVWDALLVKMPLTAMIRNLGVMAKVGLLRAHSAAELRVVKRLTDSEALRKARVHPIAMLSALRVYAQGRGVRGDGTWTPTSRVIDALDEGFYRAFQNVEPSGQRVMLALDVSGSMAAGVVAGVPGLTPRDASAAMALVTARTESNYSMSAFQGQMVEINISARMRLDDVMKVISGLPFGATDCAQPMLYALERKLAVDTFVIYTDSETWFGSIHPVQALRQYREQMGIAARLVVVAMTSNGFSIADPQDAGMLDVVGFDTATPQMITDFARGQL
ncbi:MAG: TROVE domain-containing protein [Anaerolineae bacterium]|nr:TROVE domain-containing protein [Anaerolineae bacterium]